MSGTWERLLARAQELEDLASAIKLAHWDQEVMMPPKGGGPRARTLATLQGIAHAKLTDAELGGLLEEALGDNRLDQAQAASVRILKRDYDKATKVPESLVRELAELEATAYQVWTQARPANDYDMLRPYLAKMIDLKKQYADAIGWETERYDALLDDFEPGMKTPEVEAMFRDLGAGLRPMVDEIIGSATDKPAFLTREFDPEVQQEFCQWMVIDLGFDTEGGRLDRSPHPFTMNVAPGDVRQTTKTIADDLMMSIFAAIHETGHAVYEQNLPDKWAGWPVYGVPSLGMHESQSRLWENQVGRGRAYCSRIYQNLRTRFSEQLSDVDEESFYRGATFPERTLIRVTADEVTYNLHVGLRFEMELAMFRDELDVEDLPDAWDQAMERWVGITPTDDKDGVMQDMHWSIGALGYFPTYTLGTLYAAAFFEKAQADLPDLDSQLADGNAEGLMDWLRDKVYSQAYLYTAKELGERIIGGPLTPQPFLDHIRSKYGELYGLNL